MKNFMVANYYLVSLSFKFHENPFTNARARVVNVHTRDKTCVRAFTTHARAGIYGLIFMKFEADEIVIDHHKTFYDDPSFCCGDICKTKLTF